MTRREGINSHGKFLNMMNVARKETFKELKEILYNHPDIGPQKDDTVTFTYHQAEQYLEAMRHNFRKSYTSLTHTFSLFRATILSDFAEMGINEINAMDLDRYETIRVRPIKDYTEDGDRIAGINVDTGATYSPQEMRDFCLIEHNWNVKRPNLDLLRNPVPPLLDKLFCVLGTEIVDRVAFNLKFINKGMDIFSKSRGNAGKSTFCELAVLSFPNAIKSKDMSEVDNERQLLYTSVEMALTSSLILFLDEFDKATRYHKPNYITKWTATSMGVSPMHTQLKRKLRTAAPMAICGGLPDIDYSAQGMSVRLQWMINDEVEYQDSELLTSAERTEILRDNSYRDYFRAMVFKRMFDMPDDYGAAESSIMGAIQRYTQEVAEEMTPIHLTELKKVFTFTNNENDEVYASEVRKVVSDAYKGNVPESLGIKTWVKQLLKAFPEAREVKWKAAKHPTTKKPDRKTGRFLYTGGDDSAPSSEGDEDTKTETPQVFQNVLDQMESN